MAKICEIGAFPVANDGVNLPTSADPLANVKPTQINPPNKNISAKIVFKRLIKNFLLILSVIQNLSKNLPFLTAKQMPKIFIPNLREPEVKENSLEKI